MENTFWQANFWGIVGTISGTLGLIISWLNWRYSKPNIKIVNLELETPYYSHINNYKQKPKQQEYWEEFKLRVRFRNKKGGAGSIEKPFLVFRYKIGNKFYFFPKFKEYILKPRTKAVELKKESENTFIENIIRLGEAWNFSGGQIIDDELEYIFRDSEFYNFILNWDKTEYFIKYYNNFGKQFFKKILSVREKY